MDIKLLSRMREMDLSSLDNEAVEQELQRSLTFAEQGILLRFATKGQSTSTRSFVHANTGEEFDGRGSRNFPPFVPDLPVAGASFDFCTVCAEFELRNAVRLGHTRNCFISGDGACQIMARLPDIIRAKEQRGCSSCTALFVGISRLCESTGFDMSQIDNPIDYDDEDIEVTVVFKKHNVLRLYLSRKSSQRALESTGLSFFASPMLEFYSRPGMLACSSTIVC
jgi:hypothetical protein